MNAHFEKFQAPKSKLERRSRRQPPRPLARKIGGWKLQMLCCSTLGFCCLLGGTNVSFAQDASSRANASGTYASDLGTVAQSQDEALDQAREMLSQAENPSTQHALEAAIKEMERSKTALVAAKNSPDKLPAAIAAEQAAYQALLKMIPRETRVSRSRRSSRGGQAGQAGQQELNQLELTSEENRYESERQASAAPNEQQREQLRVADKLKELAQRQQDLNERLKELQTALNEARTEQEREEAQRQLKRLTDEEKQMLADMDELRQQLDSSPNANSMSKARQQLEQTRSDTQRAAQQLENKSASQALAAGTRAQQEMEKLRNDLRNQTSSQFAEQMRRMRNQARDLSSKEEEIGRGLESLNNPGHKSLDDSAQRKQVAEQMDKQQEALTNLLSNMQSVSEQAESTEPLLSQQLYDTLRRANQLHTDNLLDAGSQMVQRGLLPQAAQAESAARTNIDELRQKVERAAESVLGNEADTLRYAQKELDDLANRLQREFGEGQTNTNAAAGAKNGANNSQQGAQSASGRGQNGTNGNSVAENSGPGEGNTNNAANGSPGQGRQQQQASGKNSGSRGQRQGQANGNRAGQQAGNSDQSGQSENQNNGQEASGESSGSQGQRQGQGRSGQQAGNSNQNGQSNNQNNGQGGSGDNPQPNDQQADASGDNNSTGNAIVSGSDTQRLSDLVRQIGANNGRGGLSYGPGGPITGSDFVDWTSRMRDVEQVLDAPEMRNQLATARERLAEFRAQFRQSRIKPKAELVRKQVLDPITEVRTQLREDLARLSNEKSLVPLDHDPVPENYSELVRKYYEKLGDGR